MPGNGYGCVIQAKARVKILNWINPYKHLKLQQHLQGTPIVNAWYIQLPPDMTYDIPAPGLCCLDSNYVEAQHIKTWRIGYTTSPGYEWSMERNICTGQG